MTETTDEPLIRLTAAAAQQIAAAAQQAGGTGTALRIAPQRRADGGIDYRMGFDGAKPGDLEIVSAGVTLLVDQRDRPLVTGMTLDYVEIEPGDFRFIFMNPNDPHYVPPRENAAGSTEHTLD